MDNSNTSLDGYLSVTDLADMSTAENMALMQNNVASAVELKRLRKLLGHIGFAQSEWRHPISHVAD